MPNASARCPRCDYDLSGIVLSWTAACPLRGTCPECGLDLAWPDVIDLHDRPHWSFEHAPAGRLLRTFFDTLRPTLVPPRLWRALRLEHPIIIPRLLIFAPAAALVVALHALLFAAILSLVVFIRFQLLGFDPQIGGWRSVIWPDIDYGFPLHPSFAGAPRLIACAIALVAAPLVLCLLPQTLRRAKVRARHIVRIQAYTLGAAPCMLAGWWLLRGALDLTDALLWPSSLAERLSQNSTAPNAVWRAAVAISITLDSLAGVWAGLWLYWCWVSAARNYLRLPQPRLVAISITLISGLIAGIFIVLIHGHDLFW